MIIETHWESWY